MKHQDLKPCPFCGGKTKIHTKHSFPREDQLDCSCQSLTVQFADDDKIGWFRIQNEELGFEIFVDFVDVFEEEGECDIRIYRLLPKAEREKGAASKFTDYLQMIENTPIINVQEAHEYLVRWTKLRSFE